MNKQERLNALYLDMIAYYAGDPMRIQHFIKVESFAALIGEKEGLDEKTLFTLKAAAYVHDIGIKPAEAKYNSSNGKYQEELGPAPAREMLIRLGFDAETTDRVCYLVGHHHTYNSIDGADYQILVEADFLVNIYEDQIPENGMYNAYERIFKTETGKKICRDMFAMHF